MLDMIPPAYGQPNGGLNPLPARFGGGKGGSPFGAAQSANPAQYGASGGNGGSMLSGLNYGGIPLGSQPGTGLDLGAPGSVALQLGALHSPVLGLLSGLIHANNLGTTDTNLSQLGLQPLGFGQTLGAMTGLNNYASGSPMGLASAIAAQQPQAYAAAMANRTGALQAAGNGGGGMMGPGGNPSAPGVSASEGANNGMAAGPV